MKDLSVIIVSYNTKALTLQSIKSIELSLQKSPLTSEMIVVDNASTDGSQKALETHLESTTSHTHIKLIFNKKNHGFGAANNIGIEKAQGRYILLFNSDVIANNVNLTELVEYMDKNKDVGGLTVDVRLENGTIDPASHRGFPTIWRSLCYFSGLEKITQRIPLLNRIFGGYHLCHLLLTTIHEIDSPTAAFFLIQKDIVDELKGFDEDFFMYGEDLDLSFRIKEKGKKIIYYPKYRVTHLKHQSGLKHSEQDVQNHTKKHFYKAMKIFYDKHYAPKNPSLINVIVDKGITLLAQLK